MFVKELASIPRSLKKSTIILTIVGGLTTIVFDAITFLLQMGKDAIAEGRIILGLTFIALYYTRRVLHSSVHLWTEGLKNKQQEQVRIVKEERISKILTLVRNKVYLSERQSMPTTRVFVSLKEYIGLVWNFKFSLPSEIINFTSIIVVFFGFVRVSTLEIKNVPLFLAIIIFISICTMIFAYIRGKYRDRYRSERKELHEHEFELREDILNIEPQGEKHSQFMLSKLRSSMAQSFAYDVKDFHSINWLALIESVIGAAGTLAIAAIKIAEVGVPNVTLETVLSIIALQTIFGTVTGKMYDFVRKIEDVREILKKIDSYKEDVVAIVETFEKEKNTKYTTATQCNVPEFKIEYKLGEKSYKLVNSKILNLESGECILLSGPTGSGKSTFIKVLTGKGMWDLMEARVTSLVYSSETRLGSQNILEELTFVNEGYDKEKLISILKGLHLYEEIQEKNSDVVQYLSETKAENYSAGQKQRLLIARMLYNLTEETRMVVFDEATNALNDAIAEQTIKFIRKYCRDKILVIASHQVDICQEVADRHFEFIGNGSGEFHLKEVA